MDEDIYEKMLEDGRDEVFNKSENIPHPYLGQLIELNCILRTTSSTNKPDIIFQHQFVGGWIWNKLWTPQIANCLHQNHIDYFYVNYATGQVVKNNQPDGNIRDEFATMIIPTMGSNWIYDINYDVLSNHHIPEAILKHNQFKQDLICQQIRESAIKAYNGNNFLEIWNGLTPYEKHKLEIYEKSYSISSIFDASIHGILLGEKFDRYDMYEQYVKSGELVTVYFCDTYDPTSRNLYTRIYDIFNKDLPAR